MRSGSRYPYPGRSRSTVSEPSHVDSNEIKRPPGSDRATARLMTPNPDTLRETLGCFATGVTVVTCRSDDGELFGVTANSFNSVSLDPPLILFSLARTLNIIAAFQDASHYAINVLGAHQRQISQQFAEPLANKWANVRIGDGVFDCPILNDALAVLECESWRQYNGGDHIIFVGRVTRVSRNTGHDPLLFYRGDYRTVAPD